MAGILNLVGNTPMVELTGLNPNKAVKIFGKLEGNNPGGSVKDRAAFGMIKGSY
jgi:S-sulfo-L-cysteine synthase (O-acetyl-L-serine-dependent)